MKINHFRGCAECRHDAQYSDNFSYELDGFMSAQPDKDWQYLAAFCRTMQGDDIHFATIIEIVEQVPVAG